MIYKNKMCLKLYRSLINSKYKRRGNVALQAQRLAVGCIFFAHFRVVMIMCIILRNRQIHQYMHLSFPRKFFACQPSVRSPVDIMQPLCCIPNFFSYT